jgi:hypothetical protein
MTEQFRFRHRVTDIFFGCVPNFRLSPAVAAANLFEQNVSQVVSDWNCHQILLG